MAPSVLRLGAAALACASSTLALEAYQLKESYNPSNFFDKFAFFSERDPNQGFVKYRNKKDATDLGLIETTSDKVTIKVDSKRTDDDGRSSVRLESVNSYNSGLFIADFAHFPKQACGAWPAFWMVGPSWPRDGEVDIYEGWNLNQQNKVVLHTDDPEFVGSCTIDPGDFTASMVWSNCWNKAPGQPGNTGCAVDESNGLFGNAAGGVYATEWTENGIQVWSWSHENVPADVTSGKPNPTTWGKPSFAAGGNKCDAKKAFTNMRMILNINLCGDAAGGLWGETCKETTKEAECYKYVQWHPEAFAQTYWEVRGISVYQLETEQAVSTTTTSTSSTFSTSTSTSTSSTSIEEQPTSTSTSIEEQPTTTSTSIEEQPTSTSTSIEEQPTSTSTSIEEQPTSTSTSEAITSTSTSTSSSETATETESECSDDIATSTTSTEGTFTPTGSPTGGTTLSTSAPATETESECPDDVATSTDGSVLPTGSSTEGVTSLPTAMSSSSSSTTKFTTSTIYTTLTSTITSCPVTVTDCPARTVTSVIAISTTVCPVTESESDVPSDQPTSTEGSLLPTGGVSVPTDGGVIVTTLRTSTTISKTTTVIVTRPTSSSGTNTDDDDDEDEDETSPSYSGSSTGVVPTSLAAPSSSSSSVGTGGAGVPPVQVVTSKASATGTGKLPVVSATGTGKAPIATAGATPGRVVVGGGVLGVVGVVIGLLMV